MLTSYQFTSNSSDPPQTEVSSKEEDKSKQVSLDESDVHFIFIM